MSMTDSKYLNLPGIAHDQPDVYETTDLPESEQSVAAAAEDHSDAIEKINLSSDEVFKKFKGTTLDPSSTDFSDRISTRRQRGYDSRSGVWEISEDKQNETTIQKYHRIKCELEQLLDDVSSQKKSKEELAKDAISVEELKEQLETLQKQLKEMKVEQVLGASLVENLSDPQGSLHKKLIGHIESFKQKKAEKDVTEADADANKMSYELWYHPEQAKFQETAAVSALDQRISVIEKALGCSDIDNKFSVLTSQTQQKSLLAVTSALTAKLSLLEPQQLDHIEGRLSALISKLDSAKEKRAALESGDGMDQNKLNELYDIAKNSEAMYSNIPTIVQRLQALHKLHEQAVQFSSALSQLDCVQQQLTCGLQEHKKLLQDVSTNLQTNTEIINKNVSSLEARIEQLKK